jgi:hypothetical protein
VNQFNRGLSKEDLASLVERYNQQFANRQMPIGIAPRVTLPADYSFNDGFFTQDLRVTRTFQTANDRARVSLFGEVFNIFNTANLTDYSGNISNSASFGQPWSRVTQIFGSGGPRAIQFGARVSF